MIVIKPSNCLSLEIDSKYPNVINGLKGALKTVKEVSGISIPGQNRRAVTNKIMSRIHKFIDKSENDDMLNLDDIITYLDHVSYVTMPVLYILYKAVTGEDLPKIVVESYKMINFVKEGMRALDSDEKSFFRDNYGAQEYLLRKPTFSGSSIVGVNDMRTYHFYEKYETPFNDLLDYITDKGDVVLVSKDYCISREVFNAEVFVKKQILVEIEPLVSNEKSIVLDSRFSEEQSNAVKGMLMSSKKIDCLTGAAGTGKTFVIASIVQNAKVNGKKIVCCAFTGKAASRMGQSEVNADHLLCPPKTIHSLISTIRVKSYKDIDLVVIDEASTMNSELFNKLVRVLPENTKIIMVGDKNQLPPIGAGQIFEDIMVMKMFPVYHLSKIYRTTDPDILKLYSDVLKSTHKVPISTNKKYIKTYNSDDSSEFIRDMVVKLFDKDENWHKDNKCIILSHTNKYVDYINYLCYNHITGKEIPYYEGLLSGNNDDDWKPLPVFWKGAKIIFTKNDLIENDNNVKNISVTNGTVGEVVGFVDDAIKIKSYDDGAEFCIDGDYPDIRLAYAMTVFKSQGSEASSVIYFHSNHIFESKRLVYTALTRAKRAVRIYVPSTGMKMSKDTYRYTILNSEVC